MNYLTTKDLIDKLTKITGKDLSDKVLQEIEFYDEYDAFYVQGKNFKGFNVFIPEFKKNIIIGYPYVIFAKNGIARLSTNEESIEYLNYNS